MLLIFDCDGVLVDTEEVSCGCFAAALARQGLSWTVEDIMRRFMGLSIGSCIEIVEREAARRLPADFVSTLQAETFQAFRNAPIQPVAGVPDLLATLDRDGVPFCVASSGRLEKMHLTLGLTELWPQFEGRVFSATMVKRGKPFPDLFLHAATSIGVAPGHCVVVEDAIAGVRAARTAGMRVLGYAAAPYADRAGLQAAGAEVFDDMKALPRLIGL